MKQAFAAAALVLIGGRAAVAQPAGGVEMALGVGGVASIAGNGRDARVMVSFPRSEGRAIEAFAGAYDGSDAFGTKAVYGVQVRRPVHKGGAWAFDPFVTYGAMGALVRYQATTCVNHHCSPHDQTRLLAPLLGLVGAGVEYTLRPRLAVRVDYQAGLAFLFLPVGARAGASVSIPLGHNGFRPAE